MLITDRLKMSAKRIRAGNWVQGHYRAKDRVCAVGGLLISSEQLAVHANPLQDKATPLVAEALGYPTPHAFGGIISWNDAKGQTAENVADTLDLAALIGEIRSQKDFAEPVKAIAWLQEEKVLCPKS